MFEKSSNIKFHENLSSESRVVPRGRTDRQIEGQTDTTKVVDTVYNFANAPKTEDCICVCFMLPSMVFDYHSLAEMKVGIYIFRWEYPDNRTFVLYIDHRSLDQRSLQQLFSCWEFVWWGKCIHCKEQL